MVVEPKEACEQALGKIQAQEKQGKQRKPTMERVQRELQPHPKKRRRAILEFTGRNPQDRAGGIKKDKEGGQEETEEHAHHHNTPRTKGGGKGEQYPAEQGEGREKQECDQYQAQEKPKDQWQEKFQRSIIQKTTKRQKSNNRPSK